MPPPHLLSALVTSLARQNKAEQERRKKKKETSVLLRKCGVVQGVTHTFHSLLFSPSFASVRCHESSIWFHSSRPWIWLTNISFKISFYPVNKWSHFSFPEIPHSWAPSRAYFSFLSSLHAPYCLQASTAASASGSQLGQTEVDNRMRTAYRSSVIEGPCQFSSGLFHGVLRTHHPRILLCLHCRGACFIQTDVSVSPLMPHYSWSPLLLLPLTLPALLKPQSLLH